MPKTADFPQFSAVPVHLQGLQHSCRGAVADSLGLDCAADHRVSTVAHGQGVRCPWCAGRAGFSASGGDSRGPAVPAR